MKFPSTILAAPTLLLCACSLFEKEEPKVVITVHSQGSDMDSPKTIFRRNIDGRPVIFKIIPEFTDKSIAAFHPFPAEDGTYGVALKLDFKGANALDIVTRTRSGEILMSMVNGTVVHWVRIDRPVHDGVFTIWRGLAEELITQMDKEYPRIKDLKSSSEFIEMTPSTRKEKKESLRRATEDEAKRTEEAARKARGDFDPEQPAPDGDMVPLNDLLQEPRFR